MTLQYNSLSTKKFNTEFLPFSSLGTTIYRLQVQMSVWLNKPRRCPEGQQYDRFPKILLKFFLVLSRVQTVLPCRPNGRTLAARNFHIKALHVRSKGMVVRTVDQMHAISI
jgi:hypothetical protein